MTAGRLAVDAVVFDLDGTLYRGRTPIAGAVDRARRGIESDSDIRRNAAALRRIFTDVAEPAREAAA